MNELPSTTHEYIEIFGDALASRVREKFTAQQMRGDRSLSLPPLKRGPIGGQADAIRAAAKAFLSGKPSVFLCCSCGVGKTLLSLAAIHAAERGRPYRAVVMCPPHLPDKWAREVLMTIPGSSVRIVEKYQDLLALASSRRPPRGPEYYVIGETSCKLGARWQPAVDIREGRPMRCPSCGVECVQEAKGQEGEEDEAHAGLLSFEDLARRRVNCSACGEPLWGWNHTLDRWPISTFIHRKMKKLFDYAIIDEVHEAASGSSAIATAMGELIASCRHTLMLTGTLLNGYAHSLFYLLMRSSPRTLAELGFSFDNVTEFIDEYGRRQTTVTETDYAGDSNKQSRGSSRRSVQKTLPGIMPSLFGEQLLDKTIFLTLEDVASELPALEETTVPVGMDAEMESHYAKLESDLTSAVRRAVATGDTRLLSTMMWTLLGWPDHPYGFGDICLKSKEGFSELICSAPTLSRSTVRPKEQALLDIIDAERAEGRQVWVFVEMTGEKDVQPRVRSLIESKGCSVKTLRAKEVPTSRREKWIEENGPGADVIISGPSLVAVGLDFFDRELTFNFPTIIFYQTGMRTSTIRQASRRAWRIGQPLDCRVFYLYYQNTFQQRMADLMGRKVEAAEALDGKFSQGGLSSLSAGSGSVGIELAKQLMEKFDSVGRGMTKRTVLSSSVATESIPSLPQPVSLFR